MVHVEEKHVNRASYKSSSVHDRLCFVGKNLEENSKWFIESSIGFITCNYS